MLVYYLVKANFVKVRYLFSSKTSNFLLRASIGVSSEEFEGNILSI